MKKINSFKVLDSYRVWLRFDDGVEGEAEFSGHVGKGVFTPWADYEFFKQARVGEHGRTLTWPGELDFGADSLWYRAHPDVPIDELELVKD